MCLSTPFTLWHLGITHGTVEKDWLRDGIVRLIKSIFEGEIAQSSCLKVCGDS